MKSFKLLLVLLGIVMSSNLVTAQTLNVQGMIRDNDGRAIANGEYAITLELFTAETGGERVFQETYSNAKVVNGVYSLDLGSLNEAAFRSLDFSINYWLNVVFQGSSISERTRLSMSPYLFGPMNAGNKIPSSGDAFFDRNIDMNGSLFVPGSFGIFNKYNGANNPVFHNSWTGHLGDFTTVNSAFGWEESKEPIGLTLSQHQGLMMTSGLKNMNDAQSVAPIFRATTDRKMIIGYDRWANPRATLDVYSIGANTGIKIGSYHELSSTMWTEPFYSINAHFTRGEDALVGNAFFKPAFDKGSALVRISPAGEGDLLFFGTRWNNNSNEKALSAFNKVMSVTVDGRVGIGTHSPEANLDVRGTVSMFGTLQRWGFNDRAPRDGITSTTDGFVIVRANSSNRMIIRIYYTAPGATSEIALGGMNTHLSNNFEGTFNVPVQRGGKWRIEFPSGHVTANGEIIFMPMGRQ